MTTTCGQCRAPCDKQRPVAFDVYACSSLCEIALCDLLDECSIAETEALLQSIRDEGPERLRKECQQRGIKP